MRPAWLLLAAVPLLAQPVIDAANPEGIVLAPNGKIRHVWNRKGIWRTGPSHPTLNALSALFQATPTGAALHGFWVKESRTISATGFSTGFFPFYLEEILVNGKWTPQFAGETESVYFDFNRLPGRLAQPVLASEANAVFYPRPKVTGQFNGHNVYDNEALLITRANRDPWAPVPLGRALRAAMRDYEKDRASAESRRANQRATTQRDKDGRYVAQGEFLPDTGNPQCQPLVTDNLAYFDKPRSVPQLLWVNAFGRCAKLDNGRLIPRAPSRSPRPPQGCAIHLRFWAELDWTRMAALLVP